MKKNGFIATALIYSFFLVFCAVLLSYISISSHNKNLLNKANDNIRTDINSKTLADIEVGSSIKFNLSSVSYNNKEIEWELFYNQGGTAEFVSSSILLENSDIDYINYYLLSLNNDCIIGNARLLTKEDIFIKIKNNIKDVLVLKNLLNTTDVLGGSVDIGNKISYLILDGDTYKNYSYLNFGNETPSLQEFISNNLSDSSIKPYGDEKDIKNVRVVISLPISINIIGGNGSKSNPYILNTNVCFNDDLLVNKVLANGYDNLDNYTIPGVNSAINDEGLRTTEDDYGISYYFRGNVKNNYVVFAKKCWQIVRITGNGNIKLILRNNDSINCNVEAKFGYISSTYKFNNSANNNAYIGYKYGSTTATTYNGTHKNSTDSTILTVLKNYYDSTNNFTNNEREMLVDSIWCNDKKVITGTGIGETETYYASYYRVIDASLNNPSLLCNDASSTNPKLSKYTIYDTIRGNGNLNNSNKIGLITADEALYSGLISNIDQNGNLIEEHVNSYLLDSTSSTWWTMSPSYYKDNNASVFAINKYGQLISTNVNKSLKVKPVIVLKADVSASGNGTVFDPYVIKVR